MKKILLVIFWTPFVLSAQKMTKLEEKADYVFFEERLDEALGYYEKIIKKSPSNKLAIYRAEICSLLTKYRKKPLDIILSYSNTQGKKDKFFKYWMGRIYLRKNEFDSAIINWNVFLGGKFYKSKEIIEETENFILQAELAKVKFTHVNDYETEHLPTVINSEYTEFSPVYFVEKKELLFVSSRPTGDPSLRNGAFHVYFSMRENNTWTIPELQYQFGDFNRSNANIEVVADDGKLFLYEEDKTGLYYSELVNEQWIDMKPFDSHLSGEEMKSHFFINEHEDRILFADVFKKGKARSLDIFESIKDPATGDWTKPYPFSLSINSADDEDYPYLTADDKTLYFSSKGHGSLGGYDIFRSDYDVLTLTWSEPEALRYPINTHDNDIHFKISENSKSGYFVSDRLESNGDYDIFFFYNEPKVLLHGNIMDSEGTGVAEATITFTSYIQEDAIVTVESDVKGYFRANLDEKHHFKVAISAGGKVIHTDDSFTPAKGIEIEKRQDFYITSDFVATQESTQKSTSFTSIQKLGSKFRNSQKAKLKNIYFGSNSYQITNESKTSINELYEVMTEFPKLRILIEGHAGNIGSHDLNMTFSQKRAEAIAFYLVSMGISQGRLIAVGFGETRPLASNDDEENGRELNRRIEIVVIE